MFSRSLRARATLVESVHTLVLAQTEPAELIAAPAAFHVGTTTILYDRNMALWAGLSVFRHPALCSGVVDLLETLGTA